MSEIDMIHHCTAEEFLNSQRDQTADSVITSPPYFGLRSYLQDDDPNKHLEIGLEQTPHEYVDKLTMLFREARRVLKDTGTLWLNLGDTYNNRRRLRSSSHQPSLNGFGECSWAEAAAAGKVRMTITTDGLKEKDALGIPWTVAFALRDDGWYLRQEIIWRKSFGKPEPTQDRLPMRHEQIFLFSKSSNYYFNREAIPEWASSSVWEIPPTGSQKHGAAYPPDLIEPCVLAGCPVGGLVLDPFVGSGTTAVVAQRLGRHYIGCDVSLEYVEMARRALAVPFNLELFK